MMFGDKKDWLCGTACIVIPLMMFFLGVYFGHADGYRQGYNDGYMYVVNHLKEVMEGVK